MNEHSQLQDELTAFTAYYKLKYKGRTLEWDHSLGTAMLEAQFTKGVKKLTVSLYQAVVLLLFNAERELRFEDVKAGAGMGAFFCSSALLSFPPFSCVVFSFLFVFMSQADTKIFGF